MTHEIHHSFVLSLYPTSRGFAFVLFERNGALFDWGVKDIKEKHKNAKAFAEIRKLNDEYRPEALVIEATSDGEKPGRTSRIRKLYRMLVRLAAEEFIDIHRYSWKDVRSRLGFAGTATRHDIAQAVATQIPAFVIRVPKPRKAWMSESRWNGLFHAAALGLVYYQQTRCSNSGNPAEAQAG